MAVDSSLRNAYVLTASGLSIIPLAPVPAQSAPAVSGGAVVNTANFTEAVAPGGLISIFGRGLAGNTSAGATPSADSARRLLRDPEQHAPASSGDIHGTDQRPAAAGAGGGQVSPGGAVHHQSGGLGGGERDGGEIRAGGLYRRPGPGDFP